MPVMLITGANRGLGLELVRQSVSAGSRVHAACRDPGSAPLLGDMARKHAGLVEVHALEVRDHAAVEKLARDLEGEAIDQLVLNAGIYPDHGMDYRTIDYRKWLETFEVNTLAPCKMAVAFLPHVEKSAGRTIAVMTSRMGSIGDNTFGGSYLYRSSKAAVNMVVKTLSVDLAGRVRVVTIHPGWVRTDMGGESAPLSVEESITGVRRVLDGIDDASNGKFLAYDGCEIPW